MHFSSAIKSLLLISIHFQGIVGLQVFNCPDQQKPVGLCRRALQLDGGIVPTLFGVAQSTQAGQTATCEQITFSKDPADNAMCCSLEFGASITRITPDAPDDFNRVDPEGLDRVCGVVPSYVI